MVLRREFFLSKMNAIFRVMTKHERTMPVMTSSKMLQKWSCDKGELADASEAKCPPHSHLLNS